MVQENQLSWRRRLLEAEEANQGEAVSFSGNYEFPFQEEYEYSIPI